MYYSRIWVVFFPRIPKSDLLPPLPPPFERRSNCFRAACPPLPVQEEMGDGGYLVSEKTTSFSTYKKSDCIPKMSIQEKAPNRYVTFLHLPGDEGEEGEEEEEEGGGQGQQAAGAAGEAAGPGIKKINWRKSYIKRVRECIHEGRKQRA